MFTITGNSGHTAYGTKEFLCDTIADVENLPIDITVGSTALVIEGSKVFILNNKKEWVEI
jgi:hypothetical protein